MARTYNAQRSLKSYRTMRERALPVDARQERKAARQALRQMATRIGNSATLWQNRDTLPAGKPSENAAEVVAPGLQEVMA